MWRLCSLTSFVSREEWIEILSVCYSRILIVMLQLLCKSASFLEDGKIGVSVCFLYIVLWGRQFIKTLYFYENPGGPMNGSPFGL